MGTEQSKSDKEKYSKDDVQRMLERQRIMFEQQQIQKNAATVAEHASLERNRTPYSFTQNDIHIGVAQPTKTSLYPNLETNAAAASPSHNRTTTYHTTPPPTSYQPLDNINAFNNNYNIGTQRLVTPTAPPAPVCTPQAPRCAPHAPVYSPKVPVGAPQAPVCAPKVPVGAPQAPICAPKVPVGAPQAPGCAPRPHFRDRSTSRPRNQARRDRDVNDELNCPTCHQKYTPKIYQCNSGHSSCSDCKNRYMCGICGQRIGDVRNITLESFIGERKVNCPNSQDGCKLILKMADLGIHEKECPFKEMRCPLADIFGQCQWRGKLPQISKHFEEAHPIHCGEVNQELTITVTRNEKHIVYLVIIGSFNFLFNLKVSELDRKIYMTVQLIGTKHSAEKWSYEVHVYNKNEPRRKYQYSDICQSNYTPLNEIFTAEQCATLPLAYADTFVNRDLLTYKFFIKKDVDSKPRNQWQGGARRRYNRKED